MLYFTDIPSDDRDIVMRDPLIEEADEALLERLQRGACNYFIEYANPSNGLVADTSRPGSPRSIAVVGFALSCYPIAVERGWMTRSAARARTLSTLKFFANSVQGGQADATGYKGFYYHFLDMERGRRVWQCELSLIDTALLLAGVLIAALYFDRNDEEASIRSLALELHARVDWPWALNADETLAQGWMPESGFLHYGWEGYNEAIILYILAIASATIRSLRRLSTSGDCRTSGRICSASIRCIRDRCLRICFRTRG
jgi:hypothetical protein